MNQNKLLLAILTASGLFFGDLARQSLILAQSDETEPTFEASNSVEEGLRQTRVQARLPIRLRKRRSNLSSSTNPVGFHIHLSHPSS